MKNKTVLFLLIFSLLMYNCKNVSKEKTNAKNKKSEPNQQLMAEGYQLTENNCFSCHSPNPSEEDGIAPTMEAVKKHYIKNSVSLEQFTQDLASFLNYPSEDISKMPDAITQFGLMPMLDYSDSDISKIAVYIYFTELEKPDWFENNYPEEKEKYMEQYNSDLSAIEMGENISLNAKGVLGKNLQEAINSGGTDFAISFCSTRAIALTDSVAISLNAKIKRVSDKYRNPINKASMAELSYIEAARLEIAQGKSPSPKLTQIENKQIGYFPIMTNEMCLKCHGQLETDISPETLEKINNLYPNDLATGYQTGELRGVWVVEMVKE